jgi:hypothetical protein
LARAPTCCVDPADALVRELADHWNLSASPSDVHWLEEPVVDGYPRQDVRAWVLAQHPEANNDVYLVSTRCAREGGLLGVSATYNITDTFAANERGLVASGALAAWRLGRDEESYRVEIADAATPISFADTHFTRGQQLRWRLTWLQRDGQLTGITRRSFKLVPPAKNLLLHAREGSVSWGEAGEQVVIPRGGAPTKGGRYVVEDPKPLAAPGNWITWAVDRVRAFEWFGSERMQVVKAIAYRSRDWLEQTLNVEIGGGIDASEFETHTEALLPSPTPSVTRGLTPRRSPEDLTPLLDPPFEEEGQWKALAGDPFVRSDPGAPNIFWTTYLRPDENRKFARVLIVLWDPSVVDLHMMSGTEEPKSATGETSAGVVPKEHLPHLVAAFNGGFQGTHGNFGMAVDDTLYVPPKPYAATVARLDDGRTGFGTWPPDLTEMPKGMNAFRQNLTPLVQGGRFNPYGRIWWGGVPEGWEDDTQTVRSGLCVTKAGFVAYFYGTKTDAEHLARAMQSADCDYALHLDMNQGHTGLEFYTVKPAELLPPMAMPLSSMWQAEGRVDRLDGYRFRGRRLFRGMQLMNFPRYIQAEARDFFYLTLRNHLPGEPITRPGHLDDTEAKWSTQELPQRSLPYAIAKTTLRADAAFPESRLNLLKVDPWRSRPTATTPEEGAILSWAKPKLAATTLWWDDGELLIQPSKPRATARALFSGTGAPAPEQRAAVGLGSEQMLLYAEIATGGMPEHSGGAFLREGLTLAGARQIVYLSDAAGLVIEGRDLNLHPARLPADAMHLERWENPGFEDIFTDTPVVERRLWRPLQKSAGPSASE